jgi:hypothetical protein
MDDGWGFVYIVKIKTRDDVYKIGATTNMKKRMSGIRSRLVYGNGNPIELIDICFTQDRYLKECMVHTRLFGMGYIEAFEGDNCPLRGDEYFILDEKELEDARKMLHRVCDPYGDNIIRSNKEFNSVNKNKINNI